MIKDKIKYRGPSLYIYIIIDILTKQTDAYYNSRTKNDKQNK